MNREKSQKIWDGAPHNAFADLLRYRGRWLVTFREADLHQDGKCGVIRLLDSVDGNRWHNRGVIAQEGLDLRDPKLSESPDGRLVLLYTGVAFTVRGKYRYRQSFVAFSEDGWSWTQPKAILPRHEWLWRLTWFGRKGYGVSYRYIDARHRKEEWTVKLVSTEDGLHYRTIKRFAIPGYPNETTVRFLPDGTMVALVRRDREHDWAAWWGRSSPPYRDWTWKELPFYLGGPNFLAAPDGTLWCVARLLGITPYGLMAKTALLQLTPEGECRIDRILPSGGDTSYAGMAFHDGKLWICYNSSHEGKTAIYLSKLLV